MTSLRVLIVDDEPLARARLRTLLSDCMAPGASHVAEAAQAVQAMDLLGREVFDLVLLDIHMPGANGLVLADQLRALSRPPAVVFVTADAGHALQAFDLAATDYLTKPVRLERLQAALLKVQRTLQAQLAPPAASAASADGAPPTLLIQDRGRAERVPLAEVLYFKAELKYITVRTARRAYILDGALNELEERHAAQFIRIHRNALVARQALRALERHFDAEEGEGWAVRLNGLDELLAVSRRQLAAVRAVLAADRRLGRAATLGLQ